MKNTGCLERIKQRQNNITAGVLGVGSVCK